MFQRRSNLLPKTAVLCVVNHVWPDGMCFFKDCHCLNCSSPCMWVIISILIFLSAFSCSTPPQVMDKYGEFYGHDRISELLGLDKAALDFSDTQKKRKHRRDSSLATV